jgi:hypothetical protein
MRLRSSWSAVVLVAAVASGCGERSRPLPPSARAPSVSLSNSLAFGCDFGVLSQLAGNYFSEAELTLVQGEISQMQSLGAFSTGAQDTGFTIMSRIAANVNAGNTDATDASSLTNGLLACMYNNPADLPAAFPEDFTVATDPAQHGAYGVRGGATDPDTAVLFSRPFTSPFSGTAPPPGTTWAGMLGGDPAPQRLLVYGRPGSSPDSYDWRVVPRSTVFSPGIIIGVCVDPFANATSLVHESNIGVLAFVNAQFMDLSTCSPTSAMRPVAGPLEFARGAVRWGVSLFAPSALFAKTLIDGLGGSTGGVHSEFGPERVDTVTLTFTVQPTDIDLGQIIAPPVVIQATHASTGSAVANVAISLTAGPNNGKPAHLLGTLTQVTNASGLATFPDLSETKPGAYILNASGTVGGRPAIVVLRTSSVRFHVRP